jgi:hypothetical protein
MRVLSDPRLRRGRPTVSHSARAEVIENPAVEGQSQFGLTVIRWGFAPSTEP